jgi:small subunit ribosomal protein S1
MTETQAIPGAMENFAALLEESFAQNASLEGSVITGRIVSITSDFALVDVGLKSEGRVPLKEFGHRAEIKIGDTIEVFVDRYEDRDGLVVLSRERRGARNPGTNWKRRSRATSASTA